ncbi:MAG: WD40 repeat domain-containing serine/threonine-protein kinase, partial [Cyanobacteria bacterium J06626_14]
MSYCFNPSCTGLGKASSLNQTHDRFCSYCGEPLTLGDRYRATDLVREHRGERVWIGIDEHRPSKPQCVIRQFHQCSNQPSSSTHFHQVAERLEALGQHPRIPSLWASFERGPQRYLVQEYLDGIALSTQLHKQGVFSEKKIRTILHHVLPILDFAHHRHVSHGDVCSENIVYAKREVTGAAKGRLALIGFGSALLTSTETASQEDSNGLLSPVKLDSPGLTTGDQNQNLEIAIQRDLYQLGMTCVQLMTNEPHAKLYNDETRLWQWEPYVREDVSDRLNRILHKLLHPDGGDRYQSAQAVLADVNDTSSGVSHRPTFVPQAQTGRASDISQAESIQSERYSATWQCVRTLRGHDAWVRSIALSMDGRLLVSGSGDKTVKLWSVDDGQLLHTFNGHSTWVRGVAMSPDTQLVVSVSNDKTVRLWNTQTREPVATLTGHGDWVRAVTFLPSPGLLATAGQDKVIHVWDLQRHQILRTLEGHVHWVLSLVPHPNGKWLFSGSRDRTIRCWNLVSGTCEYTLSGHSSEVTGLAINAQGDRLFSSSGDQTIGIWDIHTRKRLQTLLLNRRSPWALIANPVPADECPDRVYSQV